MQRQGLIRELELEKSYELSLPLRSYFINISLCIIIPSYTASALRIAQPWLNKWIDGWMNGWISQNISEEYMEVF